MEEELHPDPAPPLPPVMERVEPADASYIPGSAAQAAASTPRLSRHPVAYNGATGERAGTMNHRGEAWGSAPGGGAGAGVLHALSPLDIESAAKVSVRDDGHGGSSGAAGAATRPGSSGSRQRQAAPQLDWGSGRGEREHQKRVARSAADSARAVRSSRNAAATRDAAASNPAAGSSSDSRDAAASRDAPNAAAAPAAAAAAAANPGGGNSTNSKPSSAQSPGRPSERVEAGPHTACMTCPSVTVYPCTRVPVHTRRILVLGLTRRIGGGDTAQRWR